MQLSATLTCGLMLLASNVFMTFAWYAHLKNLSSSAWWIAALVSWGIALFEYLLMVPANRIGFTELSLPQLKIMQEAITLGVFVPFAIFYMGQPVKLDYLWAGLCIMGAVLLYVIRGGTYVIRGFLRGASALPHTAPTNMSDGVINGRSSPDALDKMSCQERPYLSCTHP